MFDPNNPWGDLPLDMLGRDKQACAVRDKFTEFLCGLTRQAPPEAVFAFALSAIMPFTDQVAPNRMMELMSFCAMGALERHDAAVDKLYERVALDRQHRGH